MSALSFERARRLATGGPVGGVMLGFVAALFPPALIVLLGLAAQILVDPQLTSVPQRGLLGLVWTDGLIEYGRRESRLMLVGLAVIAGCLALLQAALITGLRRSAQANGRRVAADLKTRIHSQAFRLGSHDSLGDGRSWPEELFVDKTELIRQGLVAWRRALPYSVVLTALLLALALSTHVWLTLLVLALAALVWRIDGRLRERNATNASLHRERARIADQRLVETLNLAPLATGYSMAELPGESFAELLRHEQSEGHRADLFESASSPCFWLMITWSVAFVLLMIGLAAQSSVPQGALLVVSLVSAFFPIRRLSRLRGSVDLFERAARDVFSYLDRSPTVQPMPDAKPLAPLRREVRLESVTLFDRVGKKILDEVSLSAPAMSRVVLLSSDMRTPRALAGLLARFYDPVAGRILFDDIDIRWGEIESVRAQTRLVLRDSLCFTGTIVENLSCGRPEFTTDRIHEAAKQCHAIDFILGLPQGFETIIGQHGARLEPTQAFRIALARAIIREPSLLVVEEPPATPDEAEQAAVDGALVNGAAGRTLLIVPSRLATLRSADLVVLFRDGKLVAHGKHTELLQNSELYRHINYIRFNAFTDIA